MALFCALCVTHAEADGDALYEQGKAAYLIQDYETVLEYYSAPAETGNAKGQWGLGKLYENGLGVEQDYERAADYFLKAVELGETSEAQANFDKLVEEGRIPADDTPNEI